METGKYYKSFPFMYVFSFLLLWLNLAAGAQDNITFKGRIIDSQTNEPLSFVTVGILNSNTGVVTNEFGEFQYHIPANLTEAKIQISCLGYQKILLDISQIDSEVFTVFKLEPEIQVLSDVEVQGKKGKPAIEIVKKAIGNIRKNYPKEKALLYGYYRDYISKGTNDGYKNLLEAALVIEDKGFNRSDFDRTKIKLEQLRFNPEINLDPSLNRSYDGLNKYIPSVKMNGKNELTILRMHDPIRNHSIRLFSYVNVFDWQFVLNHQFSYESITQADSSLIYCINFKTQRKNDITLGEYWVNGQIYIDSQKYAILKFIYTIDCELPSYKGRFFELKLEYKDFGDKYYLNYLSLMNYFELKGNIANKKASNIGESFFQYRELFINKIVTAPFESLTREETINKDLSLFINTVSVINGFWEKYNYPSNLKLLE